MKRFILLLFLLIFLSFPLVSSVQTEINPEYKKGETIIAKISGNFLENIQKSDIHFYRRHLTTSMNPYDVVKINGEFYITAKIGEEKIPDNYSIVIENVLHMEGSQKTREDIVMEFILLDETAEFSVWPGSIYTYEDFSIEVQNLQYSSLEITINDFENDTSTSWSFLDWLFGGGNSGSSGEGDESITLLSGEIENIDFDIGNETQTTTIRLSSENQIYDIPAYLIYLAPEINDSQDNETIINETIEEGEEGGINETEGSEENTLIENETIEEGENLEEILTEEEIEEIENDPVFEEGGVLRTCVELGGNACNTNEICNGTEKSAKDRICCLGECIAKEEEKKDNTKIIGWALIGVVAIIIFYFIRKQSKNKKKSVDLKKRIRI
jgi:hypothetical protein